MVFLIICVAIAALVIFAQVQNRKAIEKRRAQLLAWAQPYVKDQLFISIDASSLIGFDFSEKQLFLATAGASGKYNFDEIASCELLRDDVSITQTNRGSQVLGVVVGEVLLGPVGALVGSMSGSKRSSARLSKLELKVVVDSQKNPVYRVVLFESKNKNGASPNDPELRPYIANADRYHGHIINAMRNSDLARQAQLSTQSVQPQLARGQRDAMNLRELFELKQIGAISEQEYETAKQKALGA